MLKLDPYQFRPLPDDFVDRPTIEHMQKWGTGLGRGLADFWFLACEGKPRSFRRRLRDEIVADLAETVQPFKEIGATDEMIEVYVNSVHAGMSERMAEILKAPAIARPLISADTLAKIIPTKH